MSRRLLVRGKRVRWLSSSKRPIRILGIESSCDDSCIGVVEADEGGGEEER
jgi:hypothetical protein